MKNKIIISLILLSLFLISGAVNVFKENNVITEEVKQEITENGQKLESDITVYVSGAINHPGTVKLAEGSSVADAIAHSGGALLTADLSKLNLSEALKDGQQLNVPEKPLKIINGEAMVGDTKHSKVNINTADEKELDTLPGIGPAMAKAIIYYRNNNGGFKNIEELKNIKGIGDSKYKKIEDCIEL